MLGTYGTLLSKAVTLNRNKKYAYQAPSLFPSKNNNNLVRDFVPKKIKFFCDAKIHTFRLTLLCSIILLRATNLIMFIVVCKSKAAINGGF